ncbi:outer membrane protein assembly factor BamB [Veronia nyctiphanis]|uniref:Outer membrane protein assembly factor BamB n=1 Tax=Veronia nyctiphanis TaxID=1278244 RepID=A0A4Q0YVE8_9GAMM|nr:outer membrane protein assembly factor BamB [Veronia nyctiphanis]RXJ73129.1 outer membrane protein assembly factor BamB [Veronia nyctiphanis]
MSKGFKRIAAMALLAGVLAGCAGEEEAVQMAPLPLVDSRFEPTLQWSQSVGDGVGRYFSELAPATANGTVFAADRDGSVKALSVESGKVLWSVNLGEDTPALLSGGVTASDDKVFIGSERGILYALNAETGESLWQANVGGELLSHPAVGNGLVVVNSSDGALSAVSESSGEGVWTLPSDVPTLTLRGNSAPHIARDGVFWGLSNGRVAAALVEPGQLAWQRSIAVPKGATEIDRLVDVDATPVVVGDRLFAIGYNGQLVSLDIRNGQLSWRRNYSSATDFKVVGNRIFLITAKDHIVAVDARSGTELWKNAALEYRLLTAPAVIDDYIVVGDSEGYLHWLDPFSGDFVAQQKLDSSGIAVAPLALEDGYLTVTRNGNLKKFQTP